jgi:hypothetical protein
MLLQYPIIIALWQYFQNSIVIRQESFPLGARPLRPGPHPELPFTIPFYGDFVAGFTLIMGLAMIVQMKVAMPPTSGGAQAKIFMYVLPLVLFVVFNRLASGLSLYYLIFNVADHRPAEDDQQPDGGAGCRRSAAGREEDQAGRSRWEERPGPPPCRRASPRTQALVKAWRRFTVKHGPD